jgi:DNA repair protein RecN (Recombination protein N)
MLRYLRVKNFALIDQLELNFEAGFNLLSGETGAGKSIIVDALALLTGAKALTETIRTGESKSTLEAVFETETVLDLTDLGIDAEGCEIIIKREIASDGRNRVFINNQPSTVGALRQIAPSLLDIHGQHEQQTLLDPLKQLTLIDAYAKAEDSASNVRALHTQIREIEEQLASLSEEKARKTERLDLLSFQRDEIQKANPHPEETEQVRTRLTVVSNSSRLVDTATRSYDVLYESEHSVAAALAQTHRSLRDASQLDSKLEPLTEQVDSARILVQDIAHNLRRYAGDVEADPRELEQLQTRLAELERLHRKYGPDLLTYLGKVTAEMDSIGLAENQIQDLSQKLERLRQEYETASSALSKARRTASRQLEGRVIRELKSLAMPNADFHVDWSDVQPGRASGIDSAEFQISANPGEAPRSIGKIASGGELSRVMLALRTVLGEDSAGKTLVFDEVDAGIGGKAAETVGSKLHELSKRYQVLCVTHLAQIAAFADHQFRIAKHVSNGRTVTRVEALEGEDRIEEIVRMMSGSRVTDAARQHIREMLAQKGE